MRCGLFYEHRLKKKGYRIVIGVDEAGRGSLAGPVVAAAVVLNKSIFKTRIDDSKKLTPLQREKAFLEICRKSVYGLGILNEKIVDQCNILVATRLAMEVAISQILKRLKSTNNKKVHILVDGNIKPTTDVSCTSIIRGDSISKTIACASIVAKVIRDRIMSIYDKIYPQYGFVRHKGYATYQHRQAIKKFGISDIHRRSFCCV